MKPLDKRACHSFYLIGIFFCRNYLTSRIGHVKFSQLQSALDELYVAKIPTIGVVANCVKQSLDMTYGYSHYYDDLVDEVEEVPVEFVNNIDSNGKASWKSSLSNLLGR